MVNTILGEAKRLYDLGWAVHWIRPNSKAPVKAGWSAPIRDSWQTLKDEYRDGYGLGVKMGKASKVGGRYLANVDVDVKSADERHRLEALEFAEKHFPGVRRLAPCVKTGYGYRFFVTTEKPVGGGKIGASGERCKVFMPTSAVNNQQENAVKEGFLTAKELAAGWRVRPAWEVEFMSEGRQVVLPPSVHPDTGKPYTWMLNRGYPERELLWVKPKGGATGVVRERGQSGAVVADFKALRVVDTTRLSQRIRDMIAGDDVENRSDAMLSVSLAMLKASYSEREVLTILTEPDTVLGDAAFEHAQTKSRARAAQWVKRYTLAKAQSVLDLRNVFRDEVKISPVKDKDGEPEPEDERHDWRGKLERGGPRGDGAPKQTLKNVLLVLDNAVSPKLFKRDEFAIRDTYGVEPPWRGRKDEPLTDDDAIAIKVWMANRFSFEPNIGLIHEAITEISCRNGYHPIRTELEALPEWDGKERLDGWLKLHFNAKGPDEYLAQVFRKWLVASVTRTYQPGAKFDWMPIFEGKQGTGKSSFGAILFGEKFFNDWMPELADREAALKLQGVRCHEFGELESLRRSEVETIKAFVTRLVDKVRPPYGRRSIESPRQVVFFGSTNKEEYLRDDTGNRRFNPVEIGHLDFGALRRDRDQLWAEALFIYRNRLEASLYLEGEAAAHAVDAQKEKMVTDESAYMIDALKEFMQAEKLKPKEDQFDFTKFKLEKLFRPMGALQEFGSDIKMLRLGGKALREIGFTKWKSNGTIYWKGR